MVKLNKIFLCVILLFSLESYAGTVTKTHNYSSALSIDGTGDFGVALTSLDFISGIDFPATDEVLSVVVSIQFHKTDGTCSRPASANPFPGEITFSLVSPNGTSVILANDNTWGGTADCQTVSVTFSSSASTAPSGTPTSGTFLPSSSLSAFATESPFGSWVLNAGDDAGSDPLCIYSYSITVETQTTLPITLVDFNATFIEKNASTLISWTTKTEVNNDYFTVERSLNAKDWFELKNVSGSGNSNSNTSYSVVDELPFDKVSYYRLKQTDFDGSSKVFKPVSVYNSQSKFVAYSREKNIIIESVPTNSFVSITDFLGRQVYSNKNVEGNLEVSNLFKGGYIVTVYNSFKTSSEKVIIN